MGGSYYDNSFEEMKTIKEFGYNLWEQRHTINPITREETENGKY